MLKGVRVSSYRRSGRAWRRGKARKKKVGVWQSWWLRVTAPFAVIVALAVVLSAILEGRPSSLGLPEGIAFPGFVLGAPLAVREAYAYAVEDPGRLQLIPCYCGCGQHSGHTSVYNCFVQRMPSSGYPEVFDSHGANCQMCVDIVLDTKVLLQQGGTLQEARQKVVERYSGLGSPTNTPPIP